MFASTRRAGALLRTVMVAAMVLVPASTARGFSVATFQGFSSNEIVSDLASTPSGIVAAHHSMRFTDNSTLTGFRYDGTVTWSASVPAPLLNGGAIERIAPASDGSVWFSMGDGSATLGRVTPTRQVTSTPVPGAGEVQTLTATPDGRVFAVVDNQLRQLGADGTPGPSIAPISYAVDLRSGPDGSIWWIDGQSAGTMSASGQVATYPLPVWAESVTADGRGHAWFGAAGEIVRLDLDTGTVNRFAGPDGDVAVDHLTTAADGSIWFSSAWLASYGRISDTGSVTSWPITDGLPTFATPTSLAAGVDGNVWLGSRASDGGPGNNFMTLLQRVNVVGTASTADDNRPRPTTPTGAGSGTGGLLKPKAPAPGVGAAPATSLTTLAPALNRLKVSRGIIRLPMQCVGGACQAEVTVSTRIGRAKGVVIASKTVNAPAGKTVKLGLRLSRPGLKAVRKAGRKGLGALVNVTLGGKTTRHRLVIKR